MNGYTSRIDPTVMQYCFKVIPITRNYYDKGSQVRSPVSLLSVSVFSEGVYRTDRIN